MYSKNLVDLVISLSASEYKFAKWRLVIDSSKSSVKAVLLHKGIICVSVPVGHSTKLKEN